MNSRRLIFAVLLVFGLWAGPATAIPTINTKPVFIFKAYDGDPEIDGPQKMSFQIDRPDVRFPTQFLKIGDFVPGTKFKLVKFEHKMRLDPKLKEQVDCSELTIRNVETREMIVLAIQ